MWSINSNFKYQPSLESLRLAMDHHNNFSSMHSSDVKSYAFHHDIDLNEIPFYNNDASSFDFEQNDISIEQLSENVLPEEYMSVRFHNIENNSNCMQSYNPIGKNNNFKLTNDSVGQNFLKVFNSLSSESVESSMDDEYMELIEMESLDDQQYKEIGTLSPNDETCFKYPANLCSLISDPIQTSSFNLNSLEIKRPTVRRCLSMSDKTLKTSKMSQTEQSPLNDRTNDLCGLKNSVFKRPDPPSVANSPVQSKRYRFNEQENSKGYFDRSENPFALKSSNVLFEGQQNFGKTKGNYLPLRKSMSMNDAEIMSALERSDRKDEPELIGDFSGPFALPIMQGRHRDLKSISSHTVARLMRGEFSDQIGSYQIIDCRYPYEFDGGHIRGAKNLYTQEQIFEEFLSARKTEEKRRINETLVPKDKRHIIIFHCEFSSERGPKLSRYLRNNDRARNTNSYPALDYPEIYLLHNGYKEFFETHAELCDPIAYRPMLEPSYNEAYRHFRAKSKSWNGDGLGVGLTRLKKSRSRLML